MKKLIAVALLAVPLTFAQNTQAPADNGNAGTATKGKKHHRKGGKKAKSDNTTATTPTK